MKTSKYTYVKLLSMYIAIHVPWQKNGVVLCLFDCHSAHQCNRAQTLLTHCTSTETVSDMCVAGGKEYVVLSARVHPGESNSSWVMRGALYTYIYVIYQSVGRRSI